MDERWFEQAEHLAASERADAIATSQRAVQGMGQADCDDCGELIPPERRQAAPFATRCIGCQAAVEMHQRIARSPFCNLP